MTYTGAPEPVKPGTNARADRMAETKEGFVAWLREEYDRRLKDRTTVEQQWLLNIAFVQGNQFAQVHKTTGELFVPEKAFPWESRDVFNRIATIYETRIAKLGRNRSLMQVVPGSPEESDVNAAKVEQQLLTSTSDQVNLPDLQADVAAWMELTGLAYMKSLWNAEAGQQVEDPMGQGTIPLGDIECTVPSPFEILPEDSLKPRLEDQRSVIHAKAWPIDSDYIKALKDKYFENAGETLQINPEDVTAVTLGRGTLGAWNPSDIRFARDNLKNHCVVLEFYEKPGHDFPNGRYAVVVGQALVHYDELPYQLAGDFPIVKFETVRRPESYYPKSIVERLIPVQRRYNQVKNSIATYLQRVGLGQWTVEEGTTDIDSLTNEPGLVVQHTRGSRPPAPVQFPPLPSTFMEELNSLEQDFMQISGLHEVSQGQVPRGTGGTPSGVMVSQLQEQDDTRLSIAQRNLDEGLQRLGRHWLMLYKQFVTEQRMVQVVGKNKTVQIVAFDATTIRSFNVRVQASSALANSPSARRDMIFAMLDRGLFNDPETGKMRPDGLQKVLEALEFGGWEDIEEDKALPQNRAAWENQLMLNGKPVQAWPWEDHTMHVIVHRRFQQTEDFYQLLESPEGQQLAMMFENHVRQHMAIMTGVAGPMAGAPMMGPEQAMQGPSDPAVDLAREAARLEAEQGPEVADEFMRQSAPQQNPELQTR